MRRSNRFRLAGLGLLSLGAVLVWASDVRAQYATAIPLSPWNSNYESSVYPVMPNNPSIPNAARYMAPSGGANQMNRVYGQMSNSMEAAMGDLPADAPDVRGRMVPYTSAYRRFDREFGRVYQANQTADAGFYEKRSQRNDLYIRAMTATNAEQRAEAQRELKAFDAKNPSLVGYSRRLGQANPNPNLEEAGPTRPAATRRGGGAPAPSRTARPAPAPSVARPSVARPSVARPSVAAPVPAAVEEDDGTPLFAQAYGGVPMLNPYAARMPIHLNRYGDVGSDELSRGISDPGPAPGLAPSPDEVLNRSQKMDDLAIPPAPEP